ncbi:MAG: carbohydrate-binding protein, partial [Coprobacillus sp.]|nr:carbohydrate-binding protein [Coprobacillus sp.]
KEAGLYNVSIPHAIGPTSGPSVDSNTENKQIVLKVDNQEVGHTVTKRFDTWSKDWNAWSTTRNVQVQVKLNAGVQRLTLSLPQGDMDIGALTFTKAKDVLNVPGYIHALDYSYGENIIAENNENVGFFDDGDKLEYTVNVQKTDNYKMQLEYAKAEKDAEFDIYVDDVLTTSSTLETTGSFSSYKKGTVAIDLTKGSHKIMFVPKNTGGFNLKSLSFGSYIQLENDLLKEGKLDGQKIIVHLNNGKFNEQLNKDNWHIDLPQGIDFDLDKVSDTEATITLKGQEVIDYDSNRTLNIEIDAKEVGDKDYLLSDQTIIEAVDDEESLEDIGDLDFDSNTFDLKITGGKFNQKIKASDLTLSEEIAQYIKVSKIEVSKDGTTATVTIERTNTNYDDLAGTIAVKPSGYSDGDLDLVSNIKLLKTDRLPECIDVKDEAVKLNESDAYRKKGTLVNGAKGDYLDFFLNVEEEGNYVLTYKVKDSEAVTNGLKLSGGLGLATDNLGSVSFGKYWGNAQGYAQMLNLKAGKQTLRLEVNNPSFELTNLQIKKLTDAVEIKDKKDEVTTITADQVVDGSKEVGWAIEGSSTKNIGFGAAGTYQDYYVDVKTAGLYDLKVNYSHNCGSDTKAIIMKVDGNTTTQLGEVTLKNTGGWANYQDSDTIEVRLEAGKQFIRIYDDIDGFNYRHVQLTFKGKQDVTAPEISGNDAIIYVDDETDIKDLLALKAIDDVDGDLSDKLTMSGDYDCHQAGTYTITVTVSDEAGNEASKTFTITVVEKAKLVIDSKEFMVGDKFDPLADVKAYDVDGTDITEKLTVVSNDVDTSKAGTYQVVYRVVDALGNEVEFTREVIVKKVKTDVDPSHPDDTKPSNPNDSSSSNQPSSSNDGQETITGQVVESTKTGDNTPIIAMMGMLLVAGLGIMVLRKRKYNR